MSISRAIHESWAITKPWAQNETTFEPDVSQFFWKVNWAHYLMSHTKWTNWNEILRLWRITPNIGRYQSRLTIQQRFTLEPYKIPDTESWINSDKEN